MLFAVTEKPGRATAEVLAEAIPAIIRQFPWPKSMRWGSGSLRWVRPLQSVLCLMVDEAGARVVPFAIEGITAGNTTEGHRFMGAGRFAVTSFEDYRLKLSRAKVMLDAAEREAQIWQEATNMAFAAGLEVVEDRGLLAEVPGQAERLSLAVPSGRFAVERRAREGRATADLTLARGLVDWQGLSQQLESATRDWRLVSGPQRGTSRLRWAEEAPQGIAAGEWRAALQRVAAALQALAQGLDQVTELAPDFVRLLERTQELARRCEIFQQPSGQDGVRWAELSAALTEVTACMRVYRTYIREGAVLETKAQWQEYFGEKVLLFSRINASLIAVVRMYQDGCA